MKLEQFPTQEAAPEKTPAEQDIERLIAQSKFKRLHPDSPSTQIEVGERRFTIESLEQSDHPDLSQVQGLFEKTFGAAEVDPEEILRSSVEGKTPEGFEDIPQRIHVIKDEKGVVVSTVTGGLLDLMDEEGLPTNKLMFMVAYAVTDPNARQGGLAREAYISAILDAAKSAKAEGKELVFAAGECTSTSEKFWNTVGWKRAYIAEGDDKKSYSEVEYVQPALDFDVETGAPAKNAGEAAEHFMVDSFGPHTPTKEAIFKAVQAFYQWNSRWDERSFTSPEAQAKHVQYVDEIENEFKRKLSAGGQLIFLDQANREKARQSGVSIKEYTAADHVEGGPEDF